MIQSAKVNSERCRRELQKCFDWLMNGFYSLWRLTVELFSNSKQKALTRENESLRETLIAQKEVLTEALRRHEPLMQRIFTLEFDQESLQQENQRLSTRTKDLEKEALFFRKLSNHQSEETTASLRAKDAQISQIREEFTLLQAEQESLKVAINILEGQKDEINEMYTRNEEEKRSLQERLNTQNTQDIAGLEETSKWKGVAEEKKIENQLMDSEISQLKEAKEQIEVERDEARKALEELREEIEDLKETSSKHLREKEEQEKISLRLESEKDSVELELAHKVGEFDKEISKRTAKIERQKNSLTDLHEALSRAKKDSSGMYGAVKRLTEEKKDLKATISSLEAEKSQLEAKLNEKQQTIDLQRKNMREWDACVAETKELADKLNKEKDELSKANSQLQVEKRELESRNQELKDEVNLAETRAVSAKAELDTGYLFLQQLMEKQIEELKQFLVTDAKKRDDNRRRDFRELKEMMDENTSLLESNQEMDNERAEWRARVAVAEGMLEMTERRLQNSEN